MSTEASQIGSQVFGIELMLHHPSIEEKSREILDLLTPVELQYDVSYIDLLTHECFSFLLYFNYNQCFIQNLDLIKKYCV